MEETLRRWENKFGDETDKQEDRETVVSESKEDEQRKDDTQADQLALTTEKVKNLEAKLSEQKAELDVLREVVLDLCVSLGLESILMNMCFSFLLVYDLQYYEIH